jgi:putative cardiolipin synthase
MPIVHAGYRHYRRDMLDAGIDLYEVRPHLGKNDGGGSGGSLKSASSGQFALHAKVFILDRRYVFLGSMNFDRRSLRLNTEIGMLIDSPELANQIIKRFDAIAQPANCYVPRLGEADAFGQRPLYWITEENGKPQQLSVEPGDNPMRNLVTSFMTLLPIDDFL